MIELVIDGEFVVVNPAHIMYIKNDEGAAIITMANGATFLSDLAYDELIDFIGRKGMVVYVDKETRERAADAAEDQVVQDVIAELEEDI